MSTEAHVGTDRRTAVIVGVLFIVALVLHLVGGVIYGPATGSEDFLERAYPDRTVVTLGLLVEFVAVMSIPLIAYFMFPVLRRFSEALALAYVGFRTVEAVFLIAIEGKVLALIDLSEEAQSADATDRRGLQAIGDSLLAENDWTFNLYILVFTAGALIFYAVLYRTGLVPRWLSIWGFAASAWMLAGVVLIMLDVFSGASDSVETIFVIPVPLGELALALWLILKGFDDRSAFTTIQTERRTLAAESAGSALKG